MANHEKEGNHILTQPLAGPIDTTAGLPEGALEDKDLALAFQRGEKGAYQAIHDRYASRVSGVCRRMLSNPHDAEDATQETFLRTYQALNRFNGRYQLGAWITRIATNVCLDQLRGAERRPADATDVDVFARRAGAPEKDSPEALFLQNAEHDRVRDVVASLPAMHRAAIVLREYEGMSYADIAVALAMTESQVKALLHRARKSFKRSWEPTGLAAFLPWRLIARIKKAPSGDAPVQLADVAVSSSHVAASCSTILQQCGHFVTERVATAVTAIVVGTAAVGAAVVPQAPPAPKGDSIERFTLDEARVRETEPPKVKKRQTASKDRDASVQPQAEPSPAPTSSPAPAEEDPPPSGSTAPPTEGKAEEKPVVNPAPPPLHTFFGWERGQAIPRAQATGHTESIDCEAKKLTHSVESLINDGAFSYRVLFQVYATGGAGRLQFSVWKDNEEIQYSSWGNEPVAAWSSDGSRTIVEISGAYGSAYGEDPDAVGLPASGQFKARLTLDCGAQSVVTESAVLTPQ